jgi:peptidyl-prolyl cis-trans isomerase C
LKQSVLIDFLVQDELAKKPVTDQEIKAEYDRQLASLGDPNTVQQYQLRQAVFANEADAKAMIASVRGGASFAKLAKEKSIDTTNDKEGLLDWLLPGQIIPAISNVIVNLDKGAMAATPILVNGAWHVIRIEDKRPFKAPSLDESKEGIRAALLQKRRLDLLGELANKAKIIQ